MENPIQKFRQNSIVFEKPGILYEKVKASYSSISFAETSHTFRTYQCLQKHGFYTLVFYIFINNSRSKQNKKNPKLPFEDIIKYKTCSKFQQKISNFMEVGARQGFQFFRQKPGS